MAELGTKLLEYIDSSSAESFESTKLVAPLGAKDHQVVVGVIKSLTCHDGIIDAQQQTNEQLKLTSEGELFVKEGSYEKKVYDVIARSENRECKQADLKDVKNAKIGISKAKMAGWIDFGKNAAGESIVKLKITEEPEDRVVQVMKGAIEGRMDGFSAKEVDDCKKRKLIALVKETVYVVRRGPKFTTSVSKSETELTPEMIATSSWKEKSFKKMNFDAMGVMPASGYLHPLLKVRAEYRQIFLEMGFSEMPTNNFVESSFWNFDALFQPQQHPARDAHDTFFLSDPATSTQFPADYLEKVKKVHSCGGFGSQGYKYDWKLEEAQKNILRTHTTAVSARMLYKLGLKVQSGEKFNPVKYFSIDRVFRNETLDATHLAEFHQIEGVVADYNLTLGDLMGVINEFFKKLGMTKLRFKPAYNPYTEPSMEVFSYHEGLKKWVEIGNSGIFRPEMLLPMGLPEDVVVIAWGLSLERPTMIKYGINNIRDLIGPKIDLSVVERSPVCRLDR